jgi:hypothetical protein
MPGQSIDAAIGRLLVDLMTPHAMEVALSVQRQLQEDRRKTEELRKAHVERLRYECETARRRYMRVDPDNRLVASSLEAQWNQCLRDLRDAEDDFVRRQAMENAAIDAKTKKKIRQLSSDFAVIWNDAQTAERERKRMIRLVLEDVTVRKEKSAIKMHIRFKSGASKTLDIPRPLSYCERTRVDKEVVKEIDQMLHQHTYKEIASILNSKGMISGQGNDFDGMRVNKVRRAYKLKSRYTRLRERGHLTVEEVTQRYGVCRKTIVQWREDGVLTGHLVNDQGRFLFEEPGPDFKYWGKKKPLKHKSITKSNRGAV